MTDPASQLYEIIKHQWKDKKFVTHTCSQCEYPCGWFWKNEALYYDAGCFCLVEKEEPEKRSPEELKKFIQDNPEVIEQNFEEEKVYPIQ